MTWIKPHDPHRRAKCVMAVWESADSFKQRLPAPVTKEMTLRRIYFLVPHVQLAKRIVDDLLLAHVEYRHVHIPAKRGTPLESPVKLCRSSDC